MSDDARVRELEIRVNELTHVLNALTQHVYEHSYRPGPSLSDTTLLPKSNVSFTNLPPLKFDEKHDFGGFGTGYNAAGESIFARTETLSDNSRNFGTNEKIQNGFTTFVGVSKRSAFGPIQQKQDEKEFWREHRPTPETINHHDNHAFEKKSGW